MAWFRASLLTTGLWISMLGATALAQENSCVFLEQPQLLNTFERPDQDVTVLGYAPERPYALLITRNLEAQWPQVYACVPDAFFSRSHLGRYINVGSFESRQQAEAVARQLQEINSSGIRILHQRRLRR